MSETKHTDTWEIHEEHSDLIVDASDRGIAFTVSSTFDGTPEERKAWEYANARRIVAAVNAFVGIPTERIAEMAPGDLIASLIEMYRKETGILRDRLVKAAENLNKIDDIIDEEGVAQSCINPFEDLRKAIRHLKQRAERAEAKVAACYFQKGQIVRVDNERFHGIGIVDAVIQARGPFIQVLLENGNVWQYEAETVEPEPINIESLPESHWIRRRHLPPENKYPVPIEVNADYGKSWEA
jgi:hypothetical protein